MTTTENTCGPTQTPDDIDIDALREKYSQERDKRLRPEGATQYLELKDDFAEFAEVDPHTPVTPRTPINEDVEVAVLGGGIAGLLAGAYLKKAGVDDVHVIEMGGDFGGVWYWNRFPGIQCDNDAYCYIPLLEELDFLPSKKFADGAEIFEHCKRIGKHFGLYDGAIFSTQVRTVRWDEPTQALAADNQPWRRHQGALRGHDAGLIQPAQTARHPRHQGLQGAHLPLGTLGLRLHRRRRQRRAAQAGRQARRARRNGRNRRAAGSASRSRRSASVRLSANSVVGGHARQRADGSAVGSFTAAWLAGGAQAQLPPLVTVRRRSDLRCSGPGLRLLD